MHKKSEVFNEVWCNLGGWRQEDGELRSACAIYGNCFRKEKKTKQPNKNHGKIKEIQYTVLNIAKV
jgi:hypothetical protein